MHVLNAPSACCTQALGSLAFAQARTAFSCSTVHARKQSVLGSSPEDCAQPTSGESASASEVATRIRFSMCFRSSLCLTAAVQKNQEGGRAQPLTGSRDETYCV